MATATTVLHSKLDQWRSDDASRAFEAGVRREDMKSFLELTGWNKTALSMIARLDNLDEDKRQDVLRSFDEMRSEMQPVWDAGDTPDMFDDPADYSEPDEFESDDPDQDPAGFGEDDTEFSAAVDQVADADGSVVPFGTTRRA